MCGLELWKNYTWEIPRTAWNCEKCWMFWYFFSIPDVVLFPTNATCKTCQNSMSYLWCDSLLFTRAHPARGVRIPLLSMQKSSGGPAQTCRPNFFRTISALIIFSKTALCNFLPLENIRGWQRCDKNSITENTKIKNNLVVWITIFNLQMDI